MKRRLMHAVWTLGIGLGLVCSAGAQAQNSDPAMRGVAKTGVRVAAGAKSKPRKIAAPGTSVTATADEPERLIQAEAIITTVKKKEGYLYMVWDVFSHQNLFNPKYPRNHERARRYAAYIAFQHGLQLNPDFSEVRFQVIVFKARDAYGGPRWDSVDKWYSYVFTKKHYQDLGLLTPEAVWALPAKDLSRLGTGGEIKE